jgi:2-dehydropantoate 2-reductase
VSQKLCIAGVGAVGATFAARLLAIGESVTLHARGARLPQLRRDGLRVDFADQTLQFPVDVSDRADFGVQDIVFLAAKAQGLPTLLTAIAPLVGPDTIIVPLVNGIPWWYFQREGGRFDGQQVMAVDPNGELARAVDSDRIVGCVMYLTAQREASGVVRALGHQKITVGSLGVDGSEPAARVAQLLSRSGMIATNPLSVVSEATLIGQFTDARLLPLVTAVIEETLAVAAALGATPTLTLDQMIAMGRRAGHFETSMLQDYRAGRALELDAIAYAVLEIAAKVGIRMPVTGHIVNLCAYRADARVQSVN